MADKYDAPKLRGLAARHLKNLLKATFDLVPNMLPAQVIQIVGLRGILDRVYEVTGQWDLNDPLRKAVLDVIFEHDASKPVGVAKPGVLAAEVVKAARDMLEFGRDMFLRMTEVPAAEGPDAYLDVVEEVTCTHCNRKWAKVSSCTGARCAMCGVSSSGP